jgi:hypothetical protein
MSLAEHSFKTIYFPGCRTLTRKPTRVTISIPLHAEGLQLDQGSLDSIRMLTGREIRAALGNPVLEDLESSARKDGRSLTVQRYGGRFEDR